MAMTAVAMTAVARNTLVMKAAARGRTPPSWPSRQGQRAVPDGGGVRRS